MSFGGCSQIEQHECLCNLPNCTFVRIVGALSDVKLDSNPTKGGLYQLCVVIQIVSFGPLTIHTKLT
jgi:hypothetical protein